MKVLVPAYFYPGVEWTRLAASSAKNPGRIVAIGNPFNGPGNAFDPNYQAVFTALRLNKGEVVGYVHTTYGNRPRQDVEADIDRWLQWYAIDGIFVDEMNNVPDTNERYFQHIHDYIQSKRPGSMVIGNPGTSTTEGYLISGRRRVSTQLCIFEKPNGFLNWKPPTWTAKYPRRNFCVLPYSTSAAQWQKFVDHAYAMNCGHVYFTDDVLPNPWDTLPGYFEPMVDYISARY